MKKLLPILILLSIITACQEWGMPPRFSCGFWIKDSIGNNLVGDSVTPNRYFYDSIKLYSFVLGHNISMKTNYATVGYDYYKGYAFGVGLSTHIDRYYLLKYNNLEEDTIRIVYGKDNINVYKNNVLIFSKNNLSQTPPVEFNIIK